MIKQFVPFELERLLSVWENRVEYNLSESGVHPLTLSELLADNAELESLAETELNYPQSNGIPVLRQRIAALYPGASADNVLVTVGAAQANFTAFMALTEVGDEVAIMQPNYQQLWGVAQNLERRLSTFALHRDLGWRLDRSELQRVITPATKFVAIVNPNNPTGRILSHAERSAILEAASDARAWLLADEVYSGVEHNTEETTPTFYGQYEKVLAVNSMSKAYGLPGLRIGWVVGPSDAIERMWGWQDYVTIGASMLGNALAAFALTPAVRSRLIARARDYVREGYATLRRWASQRTDIELLAPDAAAICFVRYDKPINSMQLAIRLLETQSTLVAPGDLFGVDGYMRLSFGLPDAYLNEGLRRIGAVLDDVS